MKNSGRFILYTGIALFVFMLVSLLMMSDALQNSDRFGELYSALLLFNAVGLIVLIILIGINLRSLLRQLREKTPGARMMVRMVATFSVLSIVPVLILYYFSLDFLYRGIDSLFDTRIEQALDDSLELSRVSIDLRMKEYNQETEQIAADFAEINDAVIPFEIDGYRDNIGASELTLMTQQGAIINYSLSDTTTLVPDIPRETILYQVQQGSSYVGLDITTNEGLSIRVVVPIPEMGIETNQRILQALYPMDSRINDLADNVQLAYTQYENFTYLQEQLKLSFILILTMVLLFSIFSVVWAAFYSAQRIISPISDLAEGTRSVAEGDYNTQLPVPSHDELGFLVSSFNQMTRRIALARDEVRQSQHEAEAQQAYLEAVLSRLSSGVMVLDKESRLRTANISCGQILGIEIESETGKTLTELKNDYHYLEKLIQTIERHLLKSELDWREQIPIFGTSGRQILMCSGTTIVLTSEQDPVHVVVFDDITALIQGQRDAAWSEMARRLAHEIKNPLTPIQLAAERLRHKYANTLSEEQFEALDRLTKTIIHQVGTMKSMVNSFSEYARPPTTSANKIDINALLQEVVDLFENLDTNANIVMDLEEDLPPIKADPDKLRRVFNNLIKNAFDASSSQEHVSLNIGTHFFTGAGTEYIEIEIRDTGVGLSEDIMSTVFEPYVTTKKKGTGLGLAIVKKIIEEHGGIVMLKNNSDNHGASAIIRLPIMGENIEMMKLAMSNRDIS